MSKADFIVIMNKQSKEMNLKKEEQEHKENMERKKSGLKSSNHKQIVDVIHHEETEEYVEDEEDQKINEEFKGVIRSVTILLIQQQRSAALEKLKQDREKENVKKMNKQ